MSRILAFILSILVAASPSLAVSSVVHVRRAGPSLTQQEAENFASQLVASIDLIAKQYARPVDRSVLIVAALQGLYQAGGMSAPAALHEQVKRADDADSKLIELVATARQRIGNTVPSQGNTAIEASLRNALRALDPYCFLTGANDYQRETDTRKDGLGLELEKNAGGPFVVKAVAPGGPAQKAGFLPGDQITHLNGMPLRTKSAKEAEPAYNWLTQGTDSRPIRFTLLRSGRSRPIETSARPGAFKAETVFGVDRLDNGSWSFDIDRKNRLAYVRLGALKTGTADDLARALGRLQAAGSRGVILDLRWCPGGLLDEAIAVACLLVGDRTIATIAYRDGKKISVARTKTGLNLSDATFLEMPIVVLVNGQTQGGGELIAAAIQDSKRGAIIGQRTVGKGSVQHALTSEQGTFYYPAPNLVVRLSVGVFTRLSGKNLQRFATSRDTDDWGVKPDAGLDFAVSRELSARLADLYLLQALRPGPSTQALPLDDPAQDPQRQFALKTLAKKINPSKLSK